MYGYKWYLLTLIKSFVFERQTRVVRNGKEPEWLTIKAGVTLGSILSSFCFLFPYFLPFIFMIMIIIIIIIIIII